MFKIQAESKQNHHSMPHKAQQKPNFVTPPKLKILMKQLLGHRKRTNRAFFLNIFASVDQN
jgi:hypothetical protein